MFLVPLIRVWYLETKIWALGMLTAMSMSFTFTLSQQIKLENMICMHTYIYLSIHLSIYLSKIYEFILIPPIASFILAFSLCFFVTPFSNSEKTTLIIYNTFTCLINPNIHSFKTTELSEPGASLWGSSLITFSIPFMCIDPFKLPKSNDLNFGNPYFSRKLSILSKF